MGIIWGSILAYFCEWGNYNALFPHEQEKGNLRAYSGNRCSGVKGTGREPGQEPRGFFAQSGYGCAGPGLGLYRNVAGMDEQAGILPDDLINRQRMENITNLILA
jgi:hypothetical protein